VAFKSFSVLDDRIARSPCRGSRLPAVEPINRLVITSKQLADLARVLFPEFEAMAYLGAVLGLRWGECTARVGSPSWFNLPEEFRDGRNIFCRHSPQL